MIDKTDYDTGSAITHRIELYRSDRIDCYNVSIDGKAWLQRIGRVEFLEGLRNALPGLRQFD